MAASFPTVDVDVAFTTDPYDAPVWAAVENFTYQFETVIGRQQQLDTFQPGQATVELDNSGRKFDPLYTSGPYFGDLTPNKRLRIQATFNGVTYPVFAGFVDGWPQDYMPPADARCMVAVTDGFKLLVRSLLNLSPFRQYDLTTGFGYAPTFFFPLSDLTGTAVVQKSMPNFGPFNALGGPSGVYPVDASLWTSAGIVPGEFPNSAIDLPAVSSFRVPGSCTLGAYAQVAVEHWARSPIGTGGLFVLASDRSVSMTATAGTFRVLHSGVTQSMTYPDDGLTHCFFASMTSAGVLAIYVDGVKGTNASTGSFTGATSSPDTIVVAGFSPVAIQNLSIWDGATVLPTDAQILDRYLAGSLAFDGDSSGDRISRILDYASWPSVDRSIDPGASRLGPATWMPTDTALNYCQLVETTEQGRFFCDQAGVATFDDRLTILNNTTPVATFTDADTAGNIHYTSLELVYDEQLIVNSVSVDWAGGSVSAGDATSQATYGVLSASVTSICETADVALNLAQWILAHYKDVFMRVKSVTLTPSAAPTTTANLLYAQALGRKIGDRITIVRTPQNVGAALTFDAIIEGIHHTASDGVHWETTFSLSKADSQTYWLLGDSVFGKLDTTTKLGY